MQTLELSPIIYKSDIVRLTFGKAKSWSVFKKKKIALRDIESLPISDGEFGTFLIRFLPRCISTLSKLLLSDQKLLPIFNSLKARWLPQPKELFPYLLPIMRRSCQLPFCELHYTPILPSSVCQSPMKLNKLLLARQQFCILIHHTLAAGSN